MRPFVLPGAALPIEETYWIRISLPIKWGHGILGVKAKRPVNCGSDLMKRTSQLRGALVGGLKLRGLSYADIYYIVGPT